MARILWAPSFQPGSYFPAVPIALELARRGHELTVLCERRSEQSFRALGLDFRPTATLDAYVAGAERPVGREAKLVFHQAYETALFADATGELAAGGYQLAMVDPLEAGAGFAAEAAGVPFFTYVHWRMDETGADVPFSFHLWDRERPPEEAFVDWWNSQRALVGLPPERRPRSEHRWYRHSPVLTLLLGLPELAHPKGELPPYAFRIGPTLWGPPGTVELPGWVEAVGRSRPAMLMSVSTVGQADAELIAQLGEAVREEPIDVVLTVPTDGELPPLPPNVRLARFVPHGPLIDRVSLVACHAGNGIVTRAACAGVPLLLFPDGRDRFQVARGATEAGLAITIDRAGLEATAVRGAIRALLDDPAYAQRAAEIARAAAGYNAATAAAEFAERLVTQQLEPMR